MPVICKAKKGGTTCKNPAKWVVSEQSVHRLNACRERLFELLAKQIPPDLILRVLTDALYKLGDPNFARSVCALVAQCDLKLGSGTKPTLHLDKFLAKLVAACPTTRNLLNSSDHFLAK